MSFVPCRGFLMHGNESLTNIPSITQVFSTTRIPSLVESRPVNEVTKSATTDCVSPCESARAVKRERERRTETRKRRKIKAKGAEIRPQATGTEPKHKCQTKWIENGSPHRQERPPNSQPTKTKRANLGHPQNRTTST